MKKRPIGKESRGAAHAAGSGAGQPVRSPRSDRRKESGRIGEDAAAAWLERGGLRLLERNWRCRLGELDLIAEDGGTLVFIEVRSARTGSRFGSAAEALHGRKQLKVRQVAGVYLQQKGWDGRPIRFDAAAVTLDASGLRALEVLHVKNAF
ncbi:YraN family protein [Paenibacillus pasadenensis]|uniref:UPF0102 protein B8V81_4647 n=1 Tax=Paenibacillus pasadenensis TaxID=217090 RepID=A0A2N5N773_9BACL|nr:YraN family protein [Paenibacillus pasadenensis]PLT46216.1 putative endonuclease distantly related to archaeal Holliday junction resolvase [Paenibacillus pasadenensis]